MLIYDIFFTFLSQHWIASLSWDPWGIYLDMNDVGREELHTLVIKYRSFCNIIQWPNERCYCSLWGHFHAMRTSSILSTMKWNGYIRFCIITMMSHERLNSPLACFSKLTTEIAPRSRITEPL